MRPTRESINGAPDCRWRASGKLERAPDEVEELLPHPELVDVRARDRAQVHHVRQARRGPPGRVQLVGLRVTEGELERATARLLQIHRPRLGIEVQAQVRWIRLEQLLVHDAVPG